jgi:hypothetical protein
VVAAPLGDLGDEPVVAGDAQHVHDHGAGRHREHEQDGEQDGPRAGDHHSARVYKGNLRFPGGSPVAAL